jgi:Cys-Gly metallodipeptidase DUG1
MADWLNAQLKQLGVDTKLVDLGRHTMDGEDLPLPPAILGRIGNDSNKKTVLIYGHFDVQPVNNSQLLTTGSKLLTIFS